jgi:transposase
VDTTLRLTHQRVDDIPLLLGFLTKLRFPQLLDLTLAPRPLHQGLSQGWLITIWITYILSHSDHRKALVRDWANDLRRALEAATGQALRDVDFTDDRLTLVLQRLSDPETWQHLEADLWNATCEVYDVPVERVRLDSTTS